MEKINKEELLEELINDYGRLVFSICYRITRNYFDSEDLTQDTFLSAYKNLDTFEGQYGKAWVSKIATNKCLDYMKNGARKMIATEDTYFIDLLEDRKEPLDLCIEEEMKLQIRDLCKSLKEPYSEVAYEHICKGKTAKELASIRKIPLKTIQTQIYRAKSMLRDCLRKE